MARIRTIKPEFWTSEQVTDCSRDARLLFIGLWNFCDDAGRHKASALRLKMEVLPGDSVSTEQVRGWVRELIAADLIDEYEVDGEEYWEVTGWCHQKIDQPTVKHPDRDGNTAKPRRRLGGKQRQLAYKKLCDRDGESCVKCGATNHLAVVHVIPFSKGGSNSLTNLQLLCGRCNAEKSDTVRGGNAAGTRQVRGGDSEGTHPRKGMESNGKESNGVDVAHRVPGEPSAVVTVDEPPDPPPPDGPQSWGAEEALFLDLWNSCPAGVRGVVRIRGMPPVMSPKDRAIFREQWPARREVAMEAMAAISGGAIEWDRQPLTIRAFFDEIDSILGGGHARRTAVNSGRDRPATRVDGSADAAAIEANQISAAEFLASCEGSS